MAEMSESGAASKSKVSRFVTRLQAGDPEAIRELVENYGARIHGFMRCLVKSEEIAEDLTQEALIRIYQKCAQVESPETFDAWLFTLSRNIAYKELKKKRRRMEVPREDEWFESRPGENSMHQAKKIGADESARILNEALSILDEKRREIMALRYFSGLSLQAIADVMNIPMGSIGTTITRSLIILKKYFDTRGVKVEDLL